VRAIYEAVGPEAAATCVSDDDRIAGGAEAEARGGAGPGTKTRAAAADAADVRYRPLRVVAYPPRRDNRLNGPRTYWSSVLDTPWHCAVRYMPAIALRRIIAV
jgi:hypothetical protein